ncbi:MAG: histidinol-phosphatase HisJ [Candidatus Atribacteria bacterium]|nr:histidinol-phosphatase HisJ [Candidatus Atribacteria bacterium]
MLCDYHIHTHRCGDAKGDYEEYIQEAVQKGITEIGLSGHCPQYFLPKKERTRQCAIPEEELELYIQEIEFLKRKYQDTMNIRIGLEMDYLPGKENDALPVINFYSWDYLLLSVHFLGDWAFDNPQYIHLYEGKNIEDIYRNYYRTVIQGIRTGYFQIMAHFDLPKKFGFRPSSPVEEETEALLACQKIGMALEINTSGLRKPVRETYPSFDILQKAHALGIPVTLGSDAHQPAEVGKDFDQAILLLRKAGFTHAAQFEQKKYHLYPLPAIKSSE